MNRAPTDGETADGLELTLRGELARGAALRAGARPVLRYLLEDHDPALVSEELVARVRGMLLDLARQLLFVQAAAAGMPAEEDYVAARQGSLAAALAREDALLGHAQALVLEAQAAQQLHRRGGPDPVLTPLIQDLLAAGADSALAGQAMAVLAAQARFMQHHRRMELPLREVPADLLHRALLVMRSMREDDELVRHYLGQNYNEAHTRAATLSRLVLALGQGAKRGLDLNQAGLAIFGSALSLASRQERDEVILSFTDRQFPRLALTLHAAGLASQDVETQLLRLHPDARLADPLVRIDRNTATRLLASSPEDEPHG